MDAQTSPKLARNRDAQRVSGLLAEARTHLIETGTRNRLIHTNRSGKRPGTIGLAYPDLNGLIELLVKDRRTIAFKADPRLAAGSEGDLDESELDGDAHLRLLASSSDVLQSRLGEEALQKKLLKLFRDAKTLEEEQGINILYLAIGFLRWFEDDSSDVVREAPLLLLPVKLVRDTRRSTFQLKLHDDEISTNLPLRERLKYDFGIILPGIRDEEELVPSSYFAAVQDAVTPQRRWTIDQEGLELGFFSFAKLLMFNDLDGDAWPDESILKHPLLERLLVSGFPTEVPLFSERTKLDEVFQPQDLIHVVDADGSQTLAIETVRAERSLVVQGPPGTGKSQTIANIIATAVHDGKTVLFIAEKVVALEVVHKRLRDCKIDNVCLELHSRASNKRLLAEELARTLKRAESEPAASDRSDRLKAIRDRLNTFARRLHTPIRNSGMTPFQTLGELAKARGRNLPPPQVHIPDLAEWDTQRFETAKTAAEMLSSIVKQSGPATSHPWRGVNNTLLQPLDLVRLRDDLVQFVNAAEDLSKLAAVGAEGVRHPKPDNLRDVDGLIAVFRVILEAPIAHADAVRHCLSIPRGGRAKLIAFAREAIKLHEEEVALKHVLKPAAFAAEAHSLRNDLARGCGSWFARFSFRYRRASRHLSTLLVAPLPRSAPDRVALLDRLIEFAAKLASFEAQQSEIAVLLGSKRMPPISDLKGLLEASAWIAKIDALNVLDRCEMLLKLSGGRDTILRFVEKLVEGRDFARSKLRDIEKVLNLEWAATFGVPCESAPIAEIINRVHQWSESTDRYNEWIALRRSDEALHDAGLSDLAGRVANGTISAESAVDELVHARAEAVWRIVAQTDPDIARATRDERSSLVEEFKHLERDRRGTVAALVRSKHAATLPEAFGSEMNVVRGEIARRRGHMPIRKLIEKAGRTIQAIKPVFMMSPISVAQYLSPGALTFDLLVIDEASQVRPEDALGAIARARQVVVVGDRKQLPPTNFFSRLLTDGGKDDEDDANAETIAPAALAGAARATELESILTLCEARGLSQKMLRWHYRSRHPSLIEVSNAEFYDSSLFLPPSTSVSTGAEGLVVHRVPGAYDRGGKRTNTIEAHAIVDAVADHAAAESSMSLGIVTFSTAQRDLVLNLLDERRRQDPVLDSYIQSAGEELFVKNLENVQGDERDIILISVGYGPRIADSLLDSMNFGPVSSEGGERRLNVLFTRARVKCEVFVSFDSGDIDLSRATGQGPRALKRFLRYAETGSLDVSTGKGDHESPLEEDVAAVIRSFGYFADAQVGTAGFRIDLGVRAAEQPGRYILAVECDGAAYHSALWARERDRLRQEVLENLGWRFHRIWSTDWFYRRETEIARLKQAIEAAALRQTGR